MATIILEIWTGDPVNSNCPAPTGHKNHEPGFVLSKEIVQMLQTAWLTGIIRKGVVGKATNWLVTGICGAPIK